MSESENKAEDQMEERQLYKIPCKRTIADTPVKLFGKQF